METLLDPHRRAFSAFVEQRDDLTMLVAATGGDTLVALQLLRDIDRASRNDLYLLLAADFVDADSFATAILTALQTQHATALEHRAQAGEAPLPPFPAGLIASRDPAASRIRSGIEFARDLIPPDSGHRLVCGIFPLDVADWSGYLALLQELTCRGTVHPWMRGVRMIARVPENFVLDASVLADASRVRVHRADFGPAAMEGAVHATAGDDRLPMARRMDALLSIAMIDIGYGRIAAANERLDLVLDYHRASDNKPMQAITMNALGDSARRAGDLPLALRWYQSALQPAADAQQAPVLTMVVQNLADVSFDLASFADAVQYYGLLLQLKEAALEEEGMARALHRRGLCRERLGDGTAAVQDLEAALLLARGFEHAHLARPVAADLARLYDREKRAADARFVRAEFGVEAVH